MNNTIPNVPRDDLDLIRAALEGFKPCIARDDALRTVRALLSAPSPAGVDRLKRYEVFPYLDDEVAEIDICESDDGSFVKYDAAHAIIDGLRGEVARLQRAEKNDAIAYKAALERQDELRTERDQHAKRIGELEGLLRDSAELIKHGVFEDGICCCGSSVDSHGLGDGHSPVDALAYHAGQVCERIDAALSAGRDSAP